MRHRLSPPVVFERFTGVAMVPEQPFDRSEMRLQRQTYGWPRSTSQRAKKAWRREILAPGRPTAPRGTLTRMAGISDMIAARSLVGRNEFRQLMA